MNDFIEKEDFPTDIVAINEQEFPDLGFVIDFDELHVYIVDQCGKLTFIIVPPYSSAEQPYVKAGIMSTIADLPCGCSATELFSNRLDLQFEEILGKTIENDENNSSTEEISTTTESISDGLSSTTKLLLNDEEDIENINDIIDNPNSLTPLFTNGTDSVLPLRIILPVSHVHFDNQSQNYYKYENVIFRSDDNNFHEHFDQVETLIDIEDERIKNFTGKIFVGNKSIDDIKSMSDGKILANSLGFFYTLNKKKNDKISEVIPLEFDLIKVPAFSQIYGVKQHYEKLNKWLNYEV